MKGIDGNRVVELALKGMSRTEIALEMGLWRGSVNRYIARHNIPVSTKRKPRADPRIRRAYDLMNQGYGREDIGVKMGDCDFVDRLFASLREHGQLLKQYGVKE